MWMTDTPGASFNRPDFQRMMSDMETGKIGIIITKDLSRLGRNQLHTGLISRSGSRSSRADYNRLNEQCGYGKCREQRPDALQKPV